MVYTLRDLVSSWQTSEFSDSGKFQHQKQDLLEDLPLTVEEAFNILDNFLSKAYQSAQIVNQRIKTGQISKDLSEFIRQVKKYLEILPYFRAAFAEHASKPFFKSLAIKKRIPEVKIKEETDLATLFLVFNSWTSTQPYEDLFMDVFILEKLLAAQPAEITYVVTGAAHSDTLSTVLQAQGYELLFDSGFTLNNDKVIKDTFNNTARKLDFLSTRDIDLSGKSIKPLDTKLYTYALLPKAELKPTLHDIASIIYKCLLEIPEQNLNNRARTFLHQYVAYQQQEENNNQPVSASFKGILLASIFGLK